MSQSDTGYDVWGVVASVLSLLVFIPYFLRNLPFRKARVFEDTLADTRCMLYGYIEDGCLDNVFILKITLQLSTVHDDAQRIINTYSTGSIYHQTMGLLCLKSLALQRMCEEVEKIRTAIKCHAAEVLGQRVLPSNTVQPVQEVYVDSLLSSANSTLQDEDDLEKALSKKHDTQDAPAYCVEFSKKTVQNTPKRRGLKTKVKNAFKSALSFKKRRSTSL